MSFDITYKETLKKQEGSHSFTKNMVKDEKLPLINAHVREWHIISLRMIFKEQYIDLVSERWLLEEK